MIHHLESYEDGYSDGKSETLKEIFEDEIEWLDYILREINIDLTIENLIHVRIKELTQKLKLLASSDTKPSVLHKELETK